MIEGHRCQEMESWSNDGCDYFAYSDTRHDHHLLQTQTAVYGSSLLLSAWYEKKFIILALKSFNLHWSTAHRACLDVTGLIQAPCQKAIGMHHMATYCHHEPMLKCDGFGAYWAIIVNLHFNFSKLFYSRPCHGSEYLWSRELVMVEGNSCDCGFLINLFDRLYRLNRSIITIEQTLAFSG